MLIRNMRADSNGTQPERKTTTLAPGRLPVRDSMEERMDRIAQLRLQRLSTLEISRRLEEEGYPGCSVHTVRRDLAQIRLRWAERTQRSLDELRGEQVAELRAVRAAIYAQTQPDYRAAVQSMDLEARLTGTLRPVPREEPQQAQQQAVLIEVQLSGSAQQDSTPAAAPPPASQGVQELT